MNDFKLNCLYLIAILETIQLCTNKTTRFFYGSTENQLIMRKQIVWNVTYNLLVYELYIFNNFIDINRI